MAKTAKSRPRSNPPASEDVNTYAVEAERGYDVDQILRRRAGRPTIG
ncbi:MAG: hypothetical protein ACRDVG_00620 [Jatrophihabitantaceae bacterium]